MFRGAQSACAEFARWLREEYAPKSIPTDGVGVQRYRLWARHFTGAELDIKETYEWGIAELDRINERMWVAAKKLYPEAKTLREVADRLENDPRYIVEGEEELLKRLKKFIVTLI